MAPKAEDDKKVAEEAVEALYDFLREYWLGNRIPWMHDIFGSEFNRGHANAITGLALIPEVRKALDAIEERRGGFDVGGKLAQWHEQFKPGESQ